MNVRNTYEHYVYLDVDGSTSTDDCVAVRVWAPAWPYARYDPLGEARAPIVIEIPDFWIHNSYTSGFKNTQVPLIGAIHVSYLLPGAVSAAGVTPASGTGFGSDGPANYGRAGDEDATAAVVEYAMGLRLDTDGNSITDKVSFADPDTVGIYAFSHPGLLATRTLINTSVIADGLDFFVGRENPTQDVFAPLELGRVKGVGTTTNESNDFAFDSGGSTTAYTDSSHYDPDVIAPDYSCVAWASVSGSQLPGIRGRSSGACVAPGSGYIVGNPAAEVLLGGPGGPRFYSVPLTTALDAVTAPAAWPSDVATLATVNATNPQVFLVGDDGLGGTFNRYDDLPGDEDFHVMLVFQDEQHVQFVEGAPAVHQAFDGFYAAGYWVRLNMDEAYFDWGHYWSSGASLTEHDAYTEPYNWGLNSDLWAYGLGSGDLQRRSELAAIAEMCDRTYFNDWSVDLSAVLDSWPRP